MSVIHAVGIWGLAIYILQSLQINKNTHHINTYNTWEGLSIDIIDENNNTNIRICNIYRPPKRNNNHAAIDNFLDEFKPKIRELAKACKNLILARDFNIDLLYKGKLQLKIPRILMPGP